MLSSYLTFGNMVEGYAATQMILPVMYLLLAYLSSEESAWLRLLCVVWVGVVAILGIIQFLYGAVWFGSAKRLGGLLGNPNGLGIFLVLGWFALLHCCAQEKLQEGKIPRVFYGLEPFFLIALGLTLSMGSFLAMAIGILTYLIIRKKQCSWQEAMSQGGVLLAKVVFGVGIGLLLYLGAARTNDTWVCILVFVYGIFAAWYWRQLEDFLMRHRRCALSIAACGLLVAGAMVLMRPSAAVTFAERLAMIGNGIGYLGVQPLWGIGPYQWRVLNLYDDDIYFNTNHIHNVFVHVGVEMGVVAMVMLLVVTIRCFGKKKSSLLLPGCVVFFIHSLMDTGFFYLGIMALLLLTVGEPRRRGRMVSASGAKSIFGVLAVVFLYNLGWYVYMV